MGIASFRLRGAAAASFVLFMGCVGDVTAMRLNTAPRPLSPRAPSAVEVFRDRVPLDGFIEIYALEIEGGAMIAEDIQAMREKAAKLGCEALVLTPEQFGPPGFGGHRLRGTCLVAR